MHGQQNIKIYVLNFFNRRLIYPVIFATDPARTLFRSRNFSLGRAPCSMNFLNFFLHFIELLNLVHRGSVHIAFADIMPSTDDI